jgi:hypothetical protein
MPHEWYPVLGSELAMNQFALRPMTLDDYEVVLELKEFHE